ncbi:MAG: type II secretion system F family protein [Nitrososphaeria archaeon]|nr:type II secretion system F family protein [Nitrososphaeria archaeon]
MGFLESFSGFSYANFRGLGIYILKMFPSISAKLESSGKRIHPEAYASIVAGITVISLIFTSILSVILLLLTGNLLISLIVFIIPALAFMMGVLYPYGEASSVSSVLESEVPYAATYLAVMATGGIAPYTSLSRIAKGELMPNIAKAAKNAEIRVKIGGVDPVSAMEDMAKGVPSKEYRDLIMGYASTLRSGGDVVHFLIRKTEQIFDARMGKMRIIGERMGMLMEAYAAITMVLSLVIYIIYIVSRAMPSEFLVLPSEQFVIFAYFIMPLLALVFLYLADITQPKYPMTDVRPYRVFYMTIPFSSIFLILFVAPFFLDFLRYIPPFDLTSSLIVELRKIMGLVQGYESSIALSIFFMILFAPGMVFYEKYGKESMSILHGMTLFLRDLTEARKTGMSPEKCIITLKDRPYGGFSKHLKVIARQIGWGESLRKVYQDFVKRVHGWMSRASLYILIDAIDVGGGAPETFDVLSTFMENLEEVEKQKRSTLLPLMIIPYMAAIMLVVVVVILVSFMRNLLQIAKIYISLAEFIHFFLPPVILIAVISGLVAGKVSSGVIAAGFKHAFILSVVSFIAVWLSGTLSIQIFSTPTMT